MTLEEYKKDLNGVEILSLHYEGCVGIEGTDIIKEGTVIDQLTERTGKILLNELFENTFGCTEVISLEDIY